MPITITHRPLTEKEKVTLGEHKIIIRKPSYLPWFCLLLLLIIAYSIVKILPAFGFPMQLSHLNWVIAPLSLVVYVILKTGKKRYESLIKKIIDVGTVEVIEFDVQKVWEFDMEEMPGLKDEEGYLFQVDRTVFVYAQLSLFIDIFFHEEGKELDNQSFPTSKLKLELLLPTKSILAIYPKEDPVSAQEPMISTKKHYASFLKPFLKSGCDMKIFKKEELPKELLADLGLW